VRIAGSMLLIALIVGTSFAVAATERVTVGLVLAGVVGWSFVPGLQLLTALLLVGATRRDRLAALERYFDTHWPWSLWILGASTVLLMVPATRTFGVWVAMTAAVPLIWTVGLLIGYCRDVLQMPAAQARRRVALHQIVTYAIMLAYLNAAVALWPRIVGLLPSP
jgi:polyferredoxin